jgi:hypothetical protein
MGRPDSLSHAPLYALPHAAVPARTAMVGWLASLLWVAELARLAAPSWVPPSVPLALVAATALLALPDISRSLRAPLTICIALLAGLVLRSWRMDALRAALDFAAPFAAFLLSIAVLRACLLSPARLRATRARLAAQDRVGRRSVLLLLSCLLGCVFSIGGLPLLAPLVADMPAAEAAGLGGTVLCGNALALLWSPFTVAMGFAAPAVGIVGGSAFLPRPLALGAAGLVVALLAHQAWRRPGAWRRAAATVAPLMPPFILAMIATLGLATGFHLGPTQAVTVMAPAAALAAWLGRITGGRPTLLHPTLPHPALPHPSGLRSAVVKLLRHALPGAGEAVRDLPMYVAGFALARALAGSGLFQALSGATMLPGLHSGMLLPPLAIVMALAGLPALVSGGIVAAASGVWMPQAAPGLRLALTLFAWLATTLLSVTGMSVLATASTFGTPVRRLIFGRNLLVAVLMAALLVLAIR